MPLVEAGRLKRHRVDEGRGAAAPTRLVLGKRDDPAAKTGAAQMLREGNQIEKEQAQRAVAEEAAEDFAAIVVADDNIEGLRVNSPEHGLVERGEPVRNRRLRARVTLRRKDQDRAAGHAPVPAAM